MSKYFRHKVKHMECGLHFIVCSNHEAWPHSTSGVVHCPECGGTSGFIMWKEEMDGFIFEDVPGGAELLAVR